MTASLKGAVRTVLPRAVSDVIFRTFLRRRALMREIEKYPRHEVIHVYSGVRLRITLEDPIAESWYDRDWPALPEIAELREHGLRRGARVFDVGAHQAIVALVLADIVGPQGRVVAIEAEPHNARVARRNLELNDTANVDVVDGAVAAEAGTVRFEENLGGRIATTARGTIDVEAVTIDDLAERFGEPDVLFVDIEGGEAAALAGAGDTLARGHATWFVEVHQGVGLELLGGSAADVVAAFPQDRFEVRVAVEAGDRGHSFRPLAAGVPDGRFFLIAAPLQPTAG